MMRELLKKVGSLTLAIGALGFVLFNAAVQHGCSGARPEPAVQDAPAPVSPGTPVSAPAASANVPAEAPPSPSATAAPAVSADPDCEMPKYMPATKAPVFVPPKCRPGGTKLEMSEPAVPNNDANSIPRQAP